MHLLLLKSFRSFILTACILLGLTGQPIKAQQLYSYAQVLDVNSGLPSNSVTRILKDSKGYIWIGTSNGLAKYDGNQFTVFRHDTESNSISGDVISIIFEDKFGNILIGANGLSIYNRKNYKWQNYPYNPNSDTTINEQKISSIYQENDSIYWVTTIYSLYRFNFNNGKFQKRVLKEKSMITISNILDGNSKGNFLIGIQNRFYKYSTTKGTYEAIGLEYSNSLGREVIYNNSICLIDKQPSSHSTFSRIDLKTNIVSSLEDDLGSDNAIVFRNDKNLFVVNESLIRVFNSDFSREKIIKFTTQDGEKNANKKLTCGLIESNGTYWIGTDKGIIKIMPQTPFHFIDNNSGLPNEYIRSLTIDRSNNLWIGVRIGSLYKLPNINQFVQGHEIPIQKIRFPTKEGIMDATNQIVELRDENLFLVTSGSLFYYNTHQQKFTSEFNSSLYGFRYFSALEVSDGVLIGSLSHPYLFKVVIESDKIKADTSVRINNMPKSVYASYKDSQNQVWLGGEGLFKAKFSNTSNTIDIETSIPAIDQTNHEINQVWSIQEIDTNRLIVCTTNNGFYIYNNRSKDYQHFTKKNGLPNDGICAVISDHHNNLWLSTKAGISFIDTHNFSIKNYIVRNGPYLCDFSFKCCTKTSNNWILFGSKQGVMYFHPDSINPDTMKYPLRINEFRIFDDKTFFEISNHDTITLKHNQNFFSFEFSLQDYRTPLVHQYRYQLLGYDKFERIADGSNPSASYTEVPPGKYIFKLSGFNMTNPSNNQVIEVVLIIQKAFYQTILFKMLIGLLVCIIIGIVIHLYIRRQILKGHLYKMEMSLLSTQMNPHFIFNTLTSIQYSILRNSKTDSIDFVSRFSLLVRSCLDYSRIEYITLDRALNFYKSYVSIESINLEEEIIFSVTLDNEIDPLRFEVSPMLIQPFIENAIVHGLAPKRKNMQLDLSIVKENNYLHCIIKDNGIGRTRAAEISRKKSQMHQSLGIELAKRRIVHQLHNGRIKKNHIEIIDNYDSQDYAIGTSVHIWILYRISDFNK